MMVSKADKERIRALLSEAITVLCKNGLGYQSEFSVEGLLGITVDKEEIFLVNIKESILRGQQQHQEEKNGHDVKSNSGEYSDQDLSFGSTLEGVTGEFIEVGHTNNSSHNNNSRRLSDRRVSSSGSTNQTHPQGRAQSIGSGIKVEQSESRHEGNSGANQAAILAGDLVLGGTPWEQSLAGSSLTVSQAVAVSAPIVAASISQMSGIAQPTQEWFMRESMRLSAQLDEQRRRSREHMRRYRQQLRTTNYTEYEDRKRRQREGMRRYRERLRMENPEKYAEMNRKHAEQERRRRMRVRSFSASFAQQAAAHQSLQAAIQTGDGSAPGTAAKLGTTDFLHMAMENSQLLPVRDMHQLIQTGFPLTSGALAVAGGLGATVGLAPAPVTLSAGSVASGTLTGLAAPQVEDDSQQQETSSHSQPSHQLISREQPSGGGGHIQQHQPAATAPSISTHNPIHHSQVLPSSSSSASPVASTSAPPHYSQGQQTMVPPDAQHSHHPDEPPLRAAMESAHANSSH